MVLAALAMYFELGLFFVERERNGDELVLVVAVAVVARDYNARITNTHLSPSTLSDGVDAEQTFAPVQGENGEEVRKKSGRRGGRGGPIEVSH